MFSNVGNTLFIYECWVAILKRDFGWGLKLQQSVVILSIKQKQKMKSIEVIGFKDYKLYKGKTWS